MPAIAFPVPRLFSDISIEVSAIKLDGDPLPEHNIDAASKTIMLYSSGRSTWGEAELTVRVGAPLQELRGKNLDDDSTFALVRLNCGPTNLRSGELVAIKNGSADIKLTIRHDQVSDRARLECFIIRDTSEGFARILREGEPWQVILSQPKIHLPTNRPSRPGGFREVIDIQWLDFSDPETVNAQLNQFSHEAYYLDLQADVPTLYLNRGIEGYYELLNAESGSKIENLFRETEYKRLSLGVWLATCFESISCINKDDDGEIEAPEGWRGEILKLILPRIFPGDSLESAYQKVVALRGPSGTSAFLISRLEMAINEHIASSTTLKKYLMALLRDGSAQL
jgi:hypothetical protein